MKPLINFVKKYYIYIVLALFVAVKTIFIGNIYAHTFYYFYSDNARYAIMAQRVLEGNYIKAVSLWWNPGFPMATIPVYLIVHSWERAQFLVSATSLILLAISGFLFLRKRSIVWALIFSFILLFSYGIFFAMSVEVDGATELLYMFLLWVSLFTGFNTILTHTKKMFLATGVLFGLTFLTRSEGSAAFLYYVLFSFFSLFLPRPKIKFRELLVNYLILIGAFSVVISPQIYFQSRLAGRFILTGKIAEMAHNAPTMIDKGRDTTWAQDVWSIDYPDFQSPHYDLEPAVTIVLFNAKIGYLFNSAYKEAVKFSRVYLNFSDKTLIAGLEKFFVVVGLIYGLFSKRFRKLTLYFFIFALCQLTFVCFFMGVNHRYIVFVIPFLLYCLSLFAYQLIELFSKLGRGQMKFLLKSLILVSFLFLFFINNWGLKDLWMHNISTSNLDKKQVGEWLKQQGIKVFAGKWDSMAFYAGARVVYLPAWPDGTFPEGIAYLKKWGTEYLVVQPGDIGYDYMRPLITPTYKDKDLTFVRKLGDTYIWKLKLTEQQKTDNMRTVRDATLNKSFAEAKLF